MIGTLIAQEFRSTWRTMFGAMGIALLVAIVSFAIAALRVPVLGGLGLGLGIIIAVLIVPFTLGLLVENYWRTMYGCEGYFTMTLPVRGRNIFAAKVVYSLLVLLGAVVATGLVAALAGIASSLSQGLGAFDFLRDTWTQFTHLVDQIGPGIPVFIAAAAALQLVTMVVVGAALMSIGAEARFNHLGFGAPVLGAIMTYFAMQIIGLAAMLFIPFGLRISGPDAGSVVAEGMLSDFIAALADPTGATEPSVIGVGIIFVTVLVTVLFAWRGARSVERHTSLR